MTNKIWNTTSICIAGIGGIIVKYLGGFDMLLKLLITSVILDYVSGIASAIYNQKLSSSIGYKGIIKKVCLFLAVAGGFVIQNIIGDAYPIRDSVIIFFICNEIISLFENIAKTGQILPEWFRKILLQVRDNTNIEISEENKDSDNQKE